MQKIMFKRAGMTACVFLLGWAGAIGYMSWQYDFDFSPWQKDEASVLPMTLDIFKRQCVGENDALMRTIVPGDKSQSIYLAAVFSCLSERSDALMHKLSLAVTGYRNVSCVQKAESEGRTDDECKKELDERMLMHRALKELSSK
ncbi:hypothetical protein SAMN03159428_04908 [Kosakonia radicincitans]|uniref:Uncharacterized protein n=1 Tax=Kosakonia radicincitans TaxID=283686 RepID=A0AAX2EZ32_9ENTR|nr:hypothetical protein [Kosakonia radicincitans]SFF37908.1 hypothetical protein SAMN03159468_04935 [Kosakonia radicincitans]SFR26211.1 hypothetical protein SAMN03159514_04895 [Kosakonia radicincitans]SFU16705.1 hypothetical protein SAMN03159428_04908 [Kosakonia radicincitans]SFY31923.1 hypothetical protein SAMN03159436_04885 [Kosakonia radicincitans]